MNELHMKDYVCKELSLDEQEIALDFVQYLEEKSLIFYKDHGGYWRDKIYYWVKYKDKCVCFIAIKNPDEPDNHWTIWSDDMGSEWLENDLNENEFKEVAWKHIGHCGHCGSCSGGRRKVIFGKEFTDVCGCTFRIDNPCRDDLMFLKRMIEIRMKEIEFVY